MKICDKCNGAGVLFDAAGSDGVPIIPKLPPDYPKPIDPNPVVARCGECGIDVHQVMHYCCMNTRCPTGLGGARFTS